MCLHGRKLDRSAWKNEPSQAVVRSMDDTGKKKGTGTKAACA